MAMSSRNFVFLLLIAVLLFASSAHAFGAGNIASISAIEGRNWRHGDIEDLLKQVACIRHHKWNSMMIKRVYFGNWLRDYSQAVDVAMLKKTNSENIRVLVWLLSFLGFGYATAEFEVTAERLGTYRPEEHIDNPKNYNDDEDARQYDPRLRGPVRQIELDIDPETGMKNYIANGKGDWATSAAYVKYSFERSIQYGRSYISGAGFMSSGKDEDLAEALRCLGQGLHTLEDFGAHTNYVELALIELGFRNIFPLVGTQTGINLRGKQTWPLVTGTFGAVDFYHSVLGEATDHFTQSEVNEMDNAMGIAQQSASSSNPLTTLVKLLTKVPGTRELCDEAERLQRASEAQARSNTERERSSAGTRGIEGFGESTRSGPDDWNAPRSDYAGSNSAYPGANYQHGYNQPPPGQYSQHGQYDQYSQPPQQSWGSPQPQYHELPAAPFDQPHNNQWQSQQPPQWEAQHNPQASSSNQYGQPQWQQPPSSHGPTSDFSQQQSEQQQQAPPAQTAKPGPNKPGQGLEGMPDFDSAKFVGQIYPILAFRDKVVRTISSIIEKIPGLEALVERIVETLTVFILSLLAPFVRPVIKAMTKSLQAGSSGVIDSSGKHQYEVWTDPRCSDPTHSMLSKDHFSNVLNQPAGRVAGEILQYIAPRVLYAWEHPEVPVDRVMADVEAIFHHPAIRNERNECHRNMFNAVKQWVDSLSDRGSNLNTILSIQGVKDGKNHKDGVNEHLAHGSSMSHGAHGGQSQYGAASQTQGGVGGMFNQAQNLVGSFTHQGGQPQHHSSGSHGGMLDQAQNLVGSFTHQGGQSQHHSSGGYGGMFDQAQNLVGNFTHHGGQQQHHSSSGYGGGQGGGLNDMLSMANKLPIPGVQNVTSTIGKFSKFMPGGGRTRGLDDDGKEGVQSRDLGEYQNDSQDFGPGGLNVPYASQIGGSSELFEAARSADAGRSPSPMPLAAPSGYEDFTSTGAYGGSQGASAGYYGAGGQSASYY